MQTMKKLLAILALAFAVNLATAQQKIATADFASIMKDFWRTKVAEGSLKKAETDLKKQLEKHFQAQTELRKQMDRALQAANAPGLPPREQQRRRDAFLKMRKEFDGNDKAIQAFRNGKIKAMQEEFRKSRKEIIDEIKVVVSAKARQGGFTLVLDEGSVLFTDKKADLTEGIITQLNLTDPNKVKPPAPKKK